MNTTIYTLSLIVVSLVTCHSGRAQTNANLKAAVSGRFSIGTHMPKWVDGAPATWRTSPGLHLSLEPAFKIRWKNSIDLSIGAGAYLNHYSFYRDDFTYNIDFLSLKYETRLSKYIKLQNGPFEYISVGCGVGVSPFSHEVHTRTVNGYQAVTESRPKDPLFFSPHIGTYKRDGRFGYSLSLQYTFYRGNSPYIYFDLTHPNAQAQATHTGNYIGLNLIIDYDLQKKEKPMEEEFPYELPTDFEERETVSEKTLNVKQRKIKILVWDHGMIDNDTVSLVLNGHTILENYSLNHSKKKVKVTLPKDVNSLTLYAHNEGSVKPNTAAVIVKVGLKKYEYVLNSTLESSEELKIIYQRE